MRNSAFLPMILSLSVLIVSLCLPSCIRNPATREYHARLLSQEAERKIGEETKKQILNEYKVLKSTEVTDYINRVGQKLASISDRPTVDFEFIVLDNDLINAFAAPGGFVFITRGLMEAIEDEAELAMVLGHEIAHVTALHGVQMIQKEMGQNALTILGTITAAIVAGPEALIMVNQTGTLFSSLYLLGYSREKELEADNLGLQYMLRAGYDPQASLRFLKELGKGEEANLRGWDLYFRTHPATADRIDIIEHMIGTGEKSNENSFIEDYQKIKAQLPKVPENEKGYFQDGVYENEFHKTYLKVPSNWELGQFQSQSLISFHTKDLKASGQLQVVQLSSTTLTAETLVYKYGVLNGYQMLNGKNLLNKAGYGFLGRFLGVSPRGNLLEYRVFGTIRYSKGYILMVGAPPEKIEAYILDLENILRSFHFS